VGDVAAAQVFCAAGDSAFADVHVGMKLHDKRTDHG
jgi:hypothetical protein